MQAFNQLHPFTTVKTILFLLAALITSTAQADCGADVLAQFEQQRAEATRIYFGMPVLSKLTAHMGTVANDIDALANFDTNEIVFDASAEFCEIPLARRAAIIAHEIGHFIAYATYPALRAARGDYHDSKQDRAMADYFGAKLIAQVDRDGLLELASAKCALGKLGYCALHDSFTYAFTH